MREVYTDFDIPVEPGKVWRALTDFPSYPQWAPFLESVKGNAVPGETLLVVAKAPGLFRMKLSPVVQSATPGYNLRWRGVVGAGWLFAGTHEWLLEPQRDGGTHVIHRERFTGLLSWFIAPLLTPSLAKGFRQFNAAFWKRCQ
ncbi:MAG: SRPBCC domain-containing protein [Deltaproteobacteria bacterium]|nr:SRPBCC domain-containing protein [Deltaproteobacteria bacterium]